MNSIDFGRVASRAGAKLMLTLLLSILLLAASAGASSAVTIDFESLDHGQIANGLHDGYRISANNYLSPPDNDFDYAVAFDTNASGTANPGLEAAEKGSPWSGGNLAGEDFGMILILQGNDDGCDTGFCADPESINHPSAGVLKLDFLSPILHLGFDGIGLQESATETGLIEFFDGETSVIVYLRDFLDENSALYDATIALGDNTANRFSVITAEYLGLTKIDRAYFELGGSGGIDNITTWAVPEPATAILLGLGLGILASRERSGRAKE